MLQKVSGTHKKCLAPTKSVWHPRETSGATMLQKVSGTHEKCLALLCCKKCLAPTKSVWRCYAAKSVWHPRERSGAAMLQKVSGTHKKCLAPTKSVRHPQTRLAPTPLVRRSYAAKSVWHTQTVSGATMLRKVSGTHKSVWHPRKVSGTHARGLALLCCKKCLAPTREVQREEESPQRHCERSEAIQYSGRSSGLLHRFYPCHLCLPVTGVVGAGNGLTWGPDTEYKETRFLKKEKGKKCTH
jgi:hypothetical protein